MNWQETVKRPASHSRSIWCPHCGEEFGVESMVEQEREEQAERTWAIAFEEGRKAKEREMKGEA